MKAFLVMGRTVKAAYDDLFACVFLSISWWIGALLLPSLFFMLASTINLPFSIAVSIALLLPLAAAPVTVGVHRVTNRIANYARIDNSLFWEAIPQHIGRGLILLAICLSVPAVILFYILVFFNNRSLIISVFCAWMLLLALMIGQFLFPLFWQQDTPDIKLALRNATLLAVRHPLYSFLMLLFQILLLALCTALVLPLILLGPALIALAGNFALAGLLQDMGLALQPPEISVVGNNTNYIEPKF